MGVEMVVCLDEAVSISIALPVQHLQPVFASVIDLGVSDAVPLLKLIKGGLDSFFKCVTTENSHLKKQDRSHNL